MELRAWPVTVQLGERFVIARDSHLEAIVVEVEVSHHGQFGFGEAAPIEHYDQTPDSVLAWNPKVRLGDDPWALDEIADGLPEGEPAGRAAIDTALHDLQGKLAGLPVYKMLGLRRDGPPTSWTVWLGDPDDMARRAEDASRKGFRRLKLKLGGRDGLDLERVQAVEGVTELPLQVDVNEYWTLDEGLELLPQMRIQYCEQPLPAGDEDCHTLADVAACAERGHGLTIKLAKSGGIREAVPMVHAARASGLSVMLGCMVESGLGIAAGAQIASLFDHVDLDGNLLLSDDPWTGLEFNDSIQRPSSAPGLGVSRA